MIEQIPAIPAYKSLDRLRADSLLDSHEFIQVVAAIIFLRWADFQEAELEAIAAFDDTDYEPVLPASMHWRVWHQLHPKELQDFLMHRLANVLNQLNNSRHNPLAVQLHYVANSLRSLSSIPTPTLKDLVSCIADQPFETPHDRRQLLRTFDQILYLSIKGQEGVIRHSLTPNSISRLMAVLADPKTGYRIYDPCFGAAGLLIDAYEVALRDKEYEKNHYITPGLNISGIEINLTPYIIGLTRLVLAGVNDPQVELGNSLERPSPDNPQQDGFDVVLANPPWGWTAKMRDRYGLEQYPIMTKDSTGLFIQHALLNLRPNGRAVIAVPNGILFRNAEMRLRKWIVENHTVEAVVSLPETSFLPFTAIKSSIIVLRRGGTTNQIRMLDGESYFQKGKGRQSATISDNDIKELVDKIRSIEISESCWDIDTETLAATEYDFTPRRRDKSDLNDIFDSLGPDVMVTRLKDCCKKIMLGRQIRSAELIDKLPPSNHSPGQQLLFEEKDSKSRQLNLFESVEPIPYIRIKDINKGQASKSTSWISSKAALGIEGRWKLRAGDVLLSKSGTIGKVGVVRNGAVGSVAASGLYVLRTDGNRLDPHYLAAFLDSTGCKAHLQGFASGGTISYLTKRIIDELPIPIPPLQIQQQVVVMWREHGEDALVYLSQILSKDERDPISEWVNNEMKNLPSEPEALTDPLDVTLLEQLAQRVHPLRNEAAHSRLSNTVLIPWILSFNEAVTSLRGVSEMPKGSALLSVFQESMLGLMAAQRAIKGNLPSEVKAKKLTDIVSRWLSRATNALFNSAQLVFGVETSSLVAGETKDIDIHVENIGLLPLRNIEIILEPEWGSRNIKFLAEKSSETIGLRAVVPQNVNPIALSVHWIAQTLDGQKVEDTREIVFQVLPGTEPKEIQKVDLGASPYVCGDPIRPERNDVFFGREDLLGQIRRQIVQSGNVVLLEGNRRAGKSSILRHLEGANKVPGWLGVYCSLQGAEGSNDGVGVPTAAVFREIAICIAKSMVSLNIEVPLPDGGTLPLGKKIGISKACRKGISEDHAFSDFRDYIETALETVSEKKLGILLMLDEFDKLQEGIDNGVTSPQVPENIRYLVQTYPDFSAILTGSRRLKRLREEYWSALFGLGTRFGVTSLTLEAAKHLVTEPVKGRLVYSREAVEKAIMLTNRQPFLLQSLCNRVFDMAAQLKIRSITLDEVEKASNLLVVDNEHFRSLWNYAETERRRFILLLIHKEADGPDPMRFGFLIDLLSTHGIEVEEESLSNDLDFLRELELIERIGDSGKGNYALAIPLMGRWIDQQHDFEVLKNRAQMETEDHNG